jgi:hypothetical protein
MIIEPFRAVVVDWRLRKEVQSLFLTHALRQPLRFGQLPNNSSLRFPSALESTCRSTSLRV